MFILLTEIFIYKYFAKLNFIPKFQKIILLKLKNGFTISHFNHPFPPERSSPVATEGHRQFERRIGFIKKIQTRKRQTNIREGGILGKSVQIIARRVQKHK